MSDYTDLSAKETDLYDENLTPMAKEYYEADYEEDEKEDFDDEDFELVEKTNRITKPTKVNEIRTQVSQMLVRGDAGMGKTTTLEHLFLGGNKIIEINWNNVKVEFLGGRILRNYKKN